MHRRNRNKKAFYVRRKSHDVTAYDLCAGHLDKDGKLLFDKYDDNNKPVILLKKHGNSHTAFQDSFLVDDGDARYFIEKSIFFDTYMPRDNSETHENKTCDSQTINLGGLWKSRIIYKQAYDLLKGHLDENNKLLVDGYDESDHPILETLESKNYVGSLDDFVVIGVRGEKYFSSRENFLGSYDQVTNSNGIE